MNVRINSLKVFVDLAASGSFSETAARHDLTQPAVSQQIGGLEAEFGTQLVERSRRRFRLTPAGEALLQTASKVLSEFDSLKSRMGGLHQSAHGELMMATTSSLGIEWLPRLIAGLKAEHPHLTLTADYQPGSRITADLAGNVADFALVPCPEADPRFESVILAEETFCFVSTPVLRQPGQSPGLSKLPFVAYAPDHPTWNLVQQNLLELNYTSAPILQFEHPETVLKAVHATRGFTCVPAGNVTEALASGELIELFPDRPRVIRQICALFLKQRLNHPMVKTLHRFLEKLSKERPSSELVTT